jgi:LPXTG-motif cell wall-anchored protein
MSGSQKQIECRSCGEWIPADSENCPSCGESTIGRGPYLAVAFGVVLFAAGLAKIGQLWFFSLLGLALVAAGGWILYDRRERTRPVEEVETREA